MRIVKNSFVLMLSIALLACTEYVPKNTSATSNPPPLPEASVDPLDNGRKLYTQNCMICHKNSGTGGKVTVEGKNLKVDDLTSESVKNLSDQKIEVAVYSGFIDDGMPAFKDKLTEAQIREVVKYVRLGIQKISTQTPATPKSK